MGSQSISKSNSCNHLSWMFRRITSADSRLTCQLFQQKRTPCARITLMNVWETLNARILISSIKLCSSLLRAEADQEVNRRVARWLYKINRTFPTMQQSAAVLSMSLGVRAKVVTRSWTRASARKLSRLSSLKTWLLTSTARSWSLTQSRVSLACQLRLWNNLCTLTWCRSMVSSLWSLSGPLQSLTECERTQERTTRLVSSPRCSKMNATRSSATFKFTCATRLSR